MTRISIPVILLLALLVANGCGSAKKTTQAASKSNGKLTEEQNINATYAYFNGIKEKITGNPDKAAEAFASCLRTDPTNHAAMYELAAIYSDQKKYGDALFFARNAASLDPSNEWYQLLLADTYEKLGKLQEAEATYDKLIKQHPNRPDFLFGKAEVLLYQNKLQEAINTYDLVEKQIGVSRELCQQKQRLYLKLGKVEAAANELEKLISSNPTDITSYSLLVELYQVNNMPEKAMQVIRRMKEVDPDNPYISLALSEQYRSEGKKEESFNELKNAFRSNQLGSDMKIRILTSYLPMINQDKEMLDQALELSNILSEVHTTEAAPQAVYGDFLAINKQNEKARDQYRVAINLDKKNLQAWQQLLLIESELSDFEAMEKEATEALEYFSDQSVLYLFKGIAQIQNKKESEAVKTLTSGSKLVVDNDAQLIEFYSNLGDANNKLKNYPESDKYYDKALKIDPNNVYVLNNFAYYLSLRNEQLEKAAEMSKKSNELSPNNASFLDTYAWVLYKQGKYADALVWMDKAMAAGAEGNGTILEHYGDALFKLGKETEALNYWQRAKNTGEHSDLLDKKISDKKLYE
jgi:tetratricopeptide (TPR) repeat protein